MESCSSPEYWNSGENQCAVGGDLRPHHPKKLGETRREVGKAGGRNNFLASTSSRYNGMTTTTSSIRVNSIMSQIGERRANVSVDAKAQSVTAMVRCIAIFYASPSNHDS